MTRLDIYKKEGLKLFKEFWKREQSFLLNSASGWTGYARAEKRFAGFLLGGSFVLWWIALSMVQASGPENLRMMKLSIPCYLFGCVGLMWSIYILVFERRIDQKQCRKLAEALDMHYVTDEDMPTGVKIAQQMGFIPKGNVSTFLKEQDGLLLQEQEISWETVFGHKMGIIFSCHLRFEIKGITVLVSDSLVSKAKGKIGNLKRIKLEWLKWEELFDVFGDDELGAREVLAPDMMLILHDLYQTLDKPAMCFVFEGNTLSLFYPLGNVENKALKPLWQYLFCNMYMLCYFPRMIHRKGLASAWQEEDIVKEFQAEKMYFQEMRAQEDLAFQRKQCAENIPDVKGLTPIMYAILDGDMEGFKQKLAEPLLDVNQCYAANGNTLLHLAAANNRLEMVECLLAFEQINLGVSNKAGQTALDIAKNRRYQAIIDLLESATKQ